MKENFTICLEETLRWEGGYSNHPLDPGGPTNLGIIQTEYDKYNTSLGRVHKSVTAITKAEAIDIYKRNYWDMCKCDDLDSGVDLIVFDFAVNSGPSRALSTLAKIGPDINLYMNERERFLHNLPTFPTFGVGWMRRTAGIRKKALVMADTPSMSTAKEIVKDNSSKLKVISIAKNAVVGTAVIGGGALNLDTLTTFTTVSAQLKTFMNDHWVGLAIAGIASFWFLLKWLEYKHIVDFKEGRYIPSGLIQGTAGKESDDAVVTQPVQSA